MGLCRGISLQKRGIRQGDPLPPLLFVICMEHLSRILKKVSEKPGFKFHPRCSPMRLTHLCFADDILLCCKGEFPSTMLMLKGFKLFSETSGLQANVQKSAIYCSGMANAEIQRILESVGFVREYLPFKYLGVPICSGKIAVVDCDKLTDKITARIRSWGTRNLYFAGRLQLINSVLLSMHSYWAQVFMLPNCILQEIERICRAFLWSGDSSSRKPGYVKWQQVCIPKYAGGLGIRNIKFWNLAALGKYVWDVEKKIDNL